MKGERAKVLEVIGVIPAAGAATRLAPLPCSKELYPVGFWSADQGQNIRPKVICHYLLEKMHSAGIRKVYIIIREGKWDIPAHLGDGTMWGMNLAYLMMRLPFGVPYTLDQAYPFVKDAIVAMGHPDTIFEPEYAFVELLNQISTSDDDIVLGLFPSDRPDKTDMVDVDHDGKIREILLKPGRTHLRYTWSIAAWRPAFSFFLHNYLGELTEHSPKEKELCMSEVLQAAIRSDFKVSAIPFADKPLLDIGTADDLLRAVRRFSACEEEDQGE